MLMVPEVADAGRASKFGSGQLVRAQTPCNTIDTQHQTTAHEEHLLL